MSKLISETSIAKSRFKYQKRTMFNMARIAKNIGILKPTIPSKSIAKTALKTMNKALIMLMTGLTPGKIAGQQVIVKKREINFFNQELSKS